ncbi:hypothetical protein D9758_015873 [Tetrapyrgos nigripes]|uniref:Uncharacterized protein n=1 Tax=Tetrapyrgos nigripes TaxID=182062 RepID=A0A8H5CJZ6_9AGAR|nr:hypothetical protein D9758_015873 [Tetrapyrgos nigripes]
MAEPVRIIVDDSELAGILLGPGPRVRGSSCASWDQSNHTFDNSFFSNRSYTSVTSSFSCPIGYNIGPVTFFGIAPPPGFNQSFALNGHIFNYSQPAHQGQLFDFPDVSEEPPIIDLGEFVIVDYALFTVDNTADLSNSVILVDDLSKEIQWNGSWEPGVLNTPMLDIREFPTPISVSPHGNTSHVSSTDGDSFTFRFAGTSIEIYGFMSSGGISDIYTFRVTIDGQQNTKNPVMLDLPGLLFSQNGLGRGNHTLVFTCEEIPGRLAVDYILYTPAFSNLADKPVFQASDSPSSSASSPDRTSTSPDSGHSSKPNVGVIVGGVIGALATCGLLILGLWLWRKTRKGRILKEHSSLMAEPFMDQNSTASQPAIPRKRRRHSAPVRSFPEPVADEWATDAKGRHVLAISTTERQNIQEYSHALDEQMQQIEVRSQAGEVDVNHLDAEMREMRATVDMLRREVGRILVPPSYDSENGGSVAGD